MNKILIVESDNNHKIKKILIVEQQVELSVNCRVK